MGDSLLSTFEFGSEEVYTLKWSHSSPDLIAVGTSNSLQIIRVNLRKNYSIRVLKVFRLGTRVNQISWGPTSTTINPPISNTNVNSIGLSNESPEKSLKVLRFDILVACSDQNLRLLSYQGSSSSKTSFNDDGDEEEDDQDEGYQETSSSIKVFGKGHSGHSGRITSIAWCTVAGYANIIASAGSDKCVLIWNIDSQDQNSNLVDQQQQRNQPKRKDQDESFRPAPTLIGPFSFTPVSISFHPTSSGRLMVYESTGTIKLIDWTKPNRPIIFSMIEPRSLINKLNGIKFDQDRIGMADWKIDEVDVFGGLSGNRWAVWDIGSSKRPGNPIATGDAWGPGVVADRFRWCPTNPRLFALSSSSPNASSAGFGAIQIYYTAFPQSPRTLYLPMEINPGRKRVHDIDWQPVKTESDVLCIAVGRQLVWIKLGVKER